MNIHVCRTAGKFSFSIIGRSLINTRTNDRGIRKTLSKDCLQLCLYNFWKHEYRETRQTTYWVNSYPNFYPYFIKGASKRILSLLKLYVQDFSYSDPN